MVFLRQKKMLTVLLILLLAMPCLAGKAGAEDSMDTFFSDAVFVGDSLTSQLGMYIREQRVKRGSMLDGARFLSATNYSLTYAAKSQPAGKVRLKVRGTEVTPQEGLRMMEAGKVFIMLGLNDHAGSNIATDINHFAMLINHIRNLNPDIMIVIESMTPIQRHLQSATLNQANLDLFNTELSQLCVEMGVYFLDIATPLKNKDGFLDAAYAYAPNNNVHLNEKGLGLWVQSLRDFAEDTVQVLEAERTLAEAEQERLRQMITPLNEVEVHYPEHLL